ncbi:MAG: hypothetical protein R2774_15230 [Saprospiraceae bacterium]
MNRLLIFTIIVMCFLRCEKVTEFAVIEQEVSISHDTIVMHQGETKNLGVFVNAGFLNYVVDSDSPNLQIFPLSGTSQASSAANISIYYSQSQTISTPFVSNVGIKTPIKNFNVVVIVIPETSSAVSPSFLNLTKQNTSAKFYIFNTSISTQQFQISGIAPYLSLDKTSGTIDIGESQIINVSFDPSKLSENTRETSQITVNIDGKLHTIDIAVSTLIPGLRLNGNLVDGKYSESLKKFYFVSSDPKGISSFDPETKRIDFVPLIYTPTCMTVSQDGKKAAIGHDAQVTYFDIESMKQIKTYNVDCKVIDIILAPNEYIYSFPEADQWSTIRCTNIATGITTNSQYASIYAGAKADLHPNGMWIYVVSTNISPNDVQKFSIAKGTAELLYDSPYHGTYPLGDNIIINPKGDKLYSNGTFLSCDAIMANDLLYRGHLDNHLPSKYALFHPAKDELFLASQQNSSWPFESNSNQITKIDAVSYETKSTFIADDILGLDGNPTVGIPIIVFIHENTLFYVARNEAKSIYELNSFSL